MCYILGVDIGTQGSKGVILNEDLKIVAKVYIEHDYFQPHPNWYEHDSEKIWWGGFKQIVRRLLQQINFSSDQIIGVGCSGLAPCFLPLDKNDRPLRNAILYGIDTRAMEEIKEITKVLGEEHILNNNKQSITTQTVGPKILWYKKNEPEKFKQTKKIFTTTNYIVYKLTGNYILDHTQAAFFGPFYNFNTHSWDKEISNLFKIPYEWFPPLKKSIDIAGTITAQAAVETGLAKGTPVITGTVDAFAEVFSTGAFKKGDVTLIYGTTGIIMINTDKCPVMKELWIVPHPVTNNAYLVIGGTAAAGALTKWYRNNFGIIEQAMQKRININAYDLLLKQAENISVGSGGLITLPYFSGERTPINDPLARGLILGLTVYHTRGHVYRSLLEGAAYSFQHHLDIFKQYGFQVSRVIACGGGTKGNLWPQIVSDVIGYDQLIPSSSLGAEIGSAYMAAVAIGLVSDLKSIRQFVESKGTHCVKTNCKSHKIYQQYYRLYRSIYENIKEDMHQLALYSENSIRKKR
jgi:xylulokinase